MKILTKRKEYDENYGMTKNRVSVTMGKIESSFGNEFLTSTNERPTQRSCGDVG